MIQNRRFLVAATFALLAIAGTVFFLSNSSAPAPAARPAAGDGVGVQPRKSKSASPDLAPSTRRLPKVTIEVREPANQEEFIGLLRSILPDKNLHRQRKALLDLMEYLTPESAPAVREIFEEMKKAGFGSEFGWWAFCTRWGEIDPVGAFEYFASRPDDPGAETVGAQLIEGWVSVDAEGAQSWLAANQDSPLFHGALRSYASTLGRWDLAQATRDVFALGMEPKALFNAIGPLVENARRHGQIPGVIQWFDGLTETQKAAAFEHAMWAIKDADLPMAVNWFTENADKPWRNDKHFNYIAGKFAIQDPKAAMEWVMTLPEDPNRPEDPLGLSTIIDVWTVKDMRAAGAWLAEQGNQPWMPLAAVAHFRALMRNNPAAGRVFLQELPPETRAAVQRHLGN